MLYSSPRHATCAARHLTGRYFLVPKWEFPFDCSKPNADALASFSNGQVTEACPRLRRASPRTHECVKACPPKADLLFTVVVLYAIYSFMTQSDKAKSWRLARKITVAELAALTGYSIEAVYAFERGSTPARSWKAGRKLKPATEPGPIQEWVWLRYKNACAGVDRRLRMGKEWDWSA